MLTCSCGLYGEGGSVESEGEGEQGGEGAGRPGPPRLAGPHRAADPLGLAVTSLVL